MTDQERRSAAVRQLEAAGAAHFVYEKNDLHGEYDQQWAEWYADYLIANGWNDLFENAWGVEDLSVALRESDAAHRAHSPNARWTEFYAPRLLTAQA